MNKQTLAVLLSDHMGWTQKKSLEFVESCFQWINQELIQGFAVVISGFGAFKVSQRKQRRLLHPISKKEILLKERLAPQFTPAEKALTLINEGGQA